MGIIAKLQWGTRKLDLESAPYSLRGDFVPPAINEGLNVAMGTSANRYEGGEVVGYKALDRNWSFSVRILDGSGSTVQTHFHARRLADFLRLAKNKTHKLYFVYKPDNDYDFNPLWGQYGGVKKYHIKSGTASLSRRYSRGKDARGKSLISRLSLTIAPYAAGLEQRLGSAVGGVLEDTIGTVDGKSRGTIIPEATTNKFINPIFGHSTWNNGWTASAGSATENTDKEFVLFGNSSTKFVNTETSLKAWYMVINVGNTNTHTLTFYAKLPDGGAVMAASHIQMFYNTSIEPDSITAVGNGWYRTELSLTGIASGVWVGANIKPRATIYLDGFQLETKQTASSWIDFNASTTEINFGSDAGLDDLHDDAFTAEAYIKADGYGENNLGIIFSKQDGAARGWRFQVDSTNGLSATIEAADTDAITHSGTDDFTADGEWHHVAMTYDDAGDRFIRFWIDGVLTVSHPVQQAAVGAIVSDAAADLTMGDTAGVDRAFDGRIAWSRISNVRRYTSPFTPTARCSPPSSDGNTVALWHFDEGTGSTLDNEEGTAARDGTASNHTWGGDCKDEYATPLTHGDMMGVAWSGTAHASASVRAAARVRVANADAMDIAEGTIRVIWKTAYPNTHPNNMFLFQTDSDFVRGFFQASDDKFYFYDGTNTINSAAQTFTAGTIHILHYIYELGSLKIYKNGVEIATGSTYTPPSIGTNIYIGSDVAPANHGSGTFLGFGTSARAMSATEVLVDFNNITKWVSGGDGLGQRLESIPWLWTKDGDDVIDNVNTAGLDNWGVIGGVPGSEDARTIWHINMPNLGDAVLLSVNPVDDFLKPDDLFVDMSGTAKGGSLGGEVLQRTITTSETVTPTSDYITVNAPFGSMLFGRQIWILAAINDADAGNSTLRASIRVDAGAILQSKYSVLAVHATDEYVFLIGPLTMPKSLVNRYSFTTEADLIIHMWIKRSTGSAIIELDWYTVFAGKLMVTPSSLVNTQDVLIDGRDVYGLGTQDDLMEVQTPSGNVVDLSPNKFNIIMCYGGDLNDDMGITDSLTFVRIIVQPRWSLV